MRTTSSSLRRGVLLLLIAAGAAVWAEASVEAQVDAYLGSIDTPIKIDQWRALGPEAQVILERRLRSMDGLPTVRARAAEALGLVGAPQHADVLLSVAAEIQSPLVVRLAAVRAAGRLLPAEKVGSALTPFLEHDPLARIRATAADVIAERLGANGCDAIERHLKVEDPDTRGMYVPALKRCARWQKP